MLIYSNKRKKKNPASQLAINKPKGMIKYNFHYKAISRPVWSFRISSWKNRSVLYNQLTANQFKYKYFPRRLSSPKWKYFLDANNKIPSNNFAFQNCKNSETTSLVFCFSPIPVHQYSFFS